MINTGCTSRSSYSVPILSPSSPDFGLAHRYSVKSKLFRRVIGNLMGPQILPGNAVTPLTNGDEIFPAMLSAINNAEESITFETFIYWDGHIGECFAEALAKKAKSGVSVHVILDWYGSHTFQSENLKMLEESGAEVKLYNPISWYNPKTWFVKLPDSNSRTHRKLLVVDGKVGFTGGVGIADVWLGDARSPEEWRETHYKVEGPVVAQMQSAFIDNWLESGGKLLDDEKYFPKLHPAGEINAQVFKASPFEATALIELMYRIAITAAESNIRIGTAYFVPNSGTKQALIAAVERGVDVEIILPDRHSDSFLVKTASRLMFDDLVENGVKIYEYLPTMYHNKIFIVDDQFVSVGSSNFDNRSFHINDEANLNTFNQEFALKMIKRFESDKAKSKELTLETLDSRPFWHYLTGSFSWLLRSEL
jgi:cardiolipin synthase A/B